MRKYSASRASIAGRNANKRGRLRVENSFIFLLVNIASATTWRQESLLVTRFRLLYMDWRGYVVAFFALVWVANQYMSIYNRLRLDIKHEQVEIKADEKKVDERKAA